MCKLNEDMLEFCGGCLEDGAKCEFAGTDECKRCFDQDEHYDAVKEEEAWYETVNHVAESPCPKCGCVETHSVYNTHGGEYCTFDKTCNNCGYVIISLMD